MKKKYEAPVAEAIRIDTKDIITVSAETEGSGLTDNWDELVK